jgi:ADP-ribosylglycohydrolase
VPLAAALPRAKVPLRAESGHEETLAALEAAEARAASGVPRRDAIARLGRGWTAEEALGVGCYCALVARDARDGLLLAVNHDGDSDSTGAIAGTLIGTELGVGGLPSEWLEPLELRDVIAAVATDLASLAACGRGDREAASRLRARYPTP